MKSVSCSLFGMLLVVGTIAVAQTAGDRFVDPFFLVEYDLAHVHFDSMPAFIGHECPQMRDHYVRAWVYGHLKTSEAEYFIVDGYVKIESDDRPGVFSVVPEDGSGFLIEIRAEGCLVDPTPYAFFPELNKAKSGIHIPDSVLDAISSELLERYAKAFGGKKAFLTSIGRVKREDLPASLRKELEIYEKPGRSAYGGRVVKSVAAVSDSSPRTNFYSDANRNSLSDAQDRADAGV